MRFLITPGCFSEESLGSDSKHGESLTGNRESITGFFSRNPFLAAELQAKVDYAALGATSGKKAAAVVEHGHRVSGWEATRLPIHLYEPTTYSRRTEAALCEERDVVGLTVGEDVLEAVLRQSVELPKHLGA